jgi:hypothetical protein
VGLFSAQSVSPMRHAARSVSRVAAPVVLFCVSTDDTLAPYRHLPCAREIIPASGALTILCAALTDDDELADPSARLTSVLTESPQR